VRKFLLHTIPTMMHFEHATVIVVGAQFIFEHATNLVTLVGTIVVFVAFQLLKGGEK
jgi:hypothetical protein